MFIYFQQSGAYTNQKKSTQQIEIGLLALLPYIVLITYISVYV